jgi:tetratricopeptide (TPR) repeat protein
MNRFEGRRVSVSEYFGNGKTDGLFRAASQKESAMATGWNYMWGESWHEYLKRKTTTNDLMKSDRESAMMVIREISGQTRSILGGLAASTQTLSSDFRTGFDEVIRSLEQGRGELREYLEGVSEEISGLNSTLESGFGQILGSLGGMGDSLESLLETAKTPTQTAAYEHFEIARDAFRQGLYPEALEALQKAIHGDRRTSGYKLEWRFHRLVGVIRLGFVGCDTDLINLRLAKEPFLLSARYARNDEPKEAACDLVQAGLIAYVQRDLSEALDHTKEAVSLDADSGEAWFQAAKFLVTAGFFERALGMLKQSIELDPRYVFKAAADPEFRHCRDELECFLSDMRKQTYGKLAPKAEVSLMRAHHQMIEVVEVKSRVAVLDRWNSLLKDDWGLFDLLRYERKFDEDQHSVDEAFAQGRARIAKENAERDRLEAKRQAEIAQAQREAQDKYEREQRARREEADRRAREQQEAAIRQQREHDEAVKKAFKYLLVFLLVVTGSLMAIHAFGAVGGTIAIIIAVVIWSSLAA